MGEVGGWEDQEERDGQADVTDFFWAPRRPSTGAGAEARAVVVQEFLPSVLYVQLSPDFEMGQPQPQPFCHSEPGALLRGSTLPMPCSLWPLILSFCYLDLT